MRGLSRHPMLRLILEGRGGEGVRADPLLGRRRRSSKGEGTPSPGLDRHLIYQVAPPPASEPRLSRGVALHYAFVGG